MMFDDPRLNAIIAAAGAVAVSVSPQGAVAANTLTALLQAAAQFQSGLASGDVTDETVAGLLAQADANLALLKADLAAQRGVQA